jgi:hypothetical protein
MADEYKDLTTEETKTSDKSTAKQYGGVVGRGLLEAVPFYGERLAEKFDAPQPETLGQRFAKRVSQNLPYNVPVMAVNPVLGGATLLGSSIAGQAAEELGGGPLTQMAAEFAGGGIPSLSRAVVGKMTGFKTPELTELTKEAKQAGYEMGPGAKSRKGMAYGAGENIEAMERNLVRATEAATERAGNAAKSIDSKWLNETQNKLGKEVDRIFGNKIFKTDYQDSSSISKVLNEAQSAFGEQGNVVKSIIESNIKGSRPGGKIIDEVQGRGFVIPLNSTFKAEDLRKAIIDVNSRLGSGSNPNQNRLLYELKNALENIAQRNLQATDPNLVKDYSKWRSDYTAYSTIRDAYARAGEEGILKGGQINPKTLLDVVIQHGGNPAYAYKNPLYKDLAVFGDVIGTPRSLSGKGLTAAATNVLGQTLPAKLAASALQPKVLTPQQEAYRRLGVYGTPFSQLQLEPPSQKDEYSRYVKE